MHHSDLFSKVILHSNSAGILQARFLCYGQPIQICSNHQGWSVAVLDDTDKPVAAKIRSEFCKLQFFPYAFSRFGFTVRKFRVGVSRYTNLLGVPLNQGGHLRSGTKTDFFTVSGWCPEATAVAEG